MYSIWDIDVESYLDKKLVLVFVAIIEALFNILREIFSVALLKSKPVVIVRSKLCQKRGILRGRTTLIHANNLPT